MYLILKEISSLISKYVFYSTESDKNDMKLYNLSAKNWGTNLYPSGEIVAKNSKK